MKSIIFSMKIHIIFIFMLSLLSQSAIAGGNTIFNAGMFQALHTDCSGDCLQDFDTGGLAYGFDIEWYTEKLKYLQLGVSLSALTSDNSPHYSWASIAVLAKKPIGKFPVFVGIGSRSASLYFTEGTYVWREQHEVPFFVVGMDYPMKIGHLRLSGMMSYGSSSATGKNLIGYDPITFNPIFEDVNRSSLVTSSTIMIGWALPL